MSIQKIREILSVEVIKELTKNTNPKCTQNTVREIHLEETLDIGRCIYVALMSDSVSAKITYLNIYLKLLDNDIDPLKGHLALAVLVEKCYDEENVFLDEVINRYKTSRANYEVAKYSIIRHRDRCGASIKDLWRKP